MKVIVCGSRHLTPWMWVSRVKRELLKLGATEVVSGCQAGGDQVGEIAASQLGLPEATKFHPDWNKYGHAAGPIRNEQMAKYADACIALPGGTGTRGMVELALKHKLILVELSPEPNSKGNK